jgi:hypothetical protein
MSAGFGDNNRNECSCMTAIQFVLPVNQRLQHFGAIKLFRQNRVFIVTRQGI